MSGTRLPWPWLCAKGLMSGVVMFPILSIAPFLPIMLSPTAGVVGTIVQAMLTLLHGIWVILPYGLLFAVVMVWRSIRWAVTGLSERDRAGRSVLWGGLLGVFWIGFILAKIHLYETDSIVGAMDWAEYALVISGLVSGGVSGWLLVRSLRPELQAIQSMKR